MAIRKTNAHFSLLNGAGNAGKKVLEVPRKSIAPVDHWAFLEEIEAPMWVDLTLELKIGNQDIDDSWFHISHPFHQRSSRQLMSAKPDHPLQGCSSPKIPSSVSRSRGKHYKTRKWEIESRQNVPSNDERHYPGKNLGCKTPREGKGSGDRTKPKPNYENTKISFPLENGTDDLKDCSSSTKVKAGESNSTSTITSEIGQQNQGPRNQTVYERSHRKFGQTNGLLSDLRISVRKSIATRLPLRVEINGGKQSDGCRSPSRKSSVGSSSNPSYEVKDKRVNAVEKRDGTPDSRTVLRLSKVAKNKVSYVPKASTIRVNPRVSYVKELTSNFRRGPNPRVSVAKPKVALAPSRVNENIPLPAGSTKLKDKVGLNRFNKMAAGGKENTIWRADASKKFGGNVNATNGSTICAQSTIKRRITLYTGTIGPKVKVHGQNEGRTQMDSSRKVYFR